MKEVLNIMYSLFSLGNLSKTGLPVEKSGSHCVHYYTPDAATLRNAFGERKDSVDHSLSADAEWVLIVQYIMDWAGESNEAEMHLSAKFFYVRLEMSSNV